MAQMYDPRYPVCMQVYILDGKWVDKALGRAARCRCPTLSHAAAFVGGCWTHRENMHLGFHATRPAYVGTVDTLSLNIGATSGGRSVGPSMPPPEDCEVLLKPTPEAIRTFNRSRAKRIGLFHVTC